MKAIPETYQWHESPITSTAQWRSESGRQPPKRFILGDDNLSADIAYKLACEGCGIVWQGDFNHARQLLQALARRCVPSPKKVSKKSAQQVALTPIELFNQHRQAQSQRARVLAMLLIPLTADYQIPLKRAPQVVEACQQAYGDMDLNQAACFVSLRELQAVIAAFEWRKKGVLIPDLDATIHPHYGVFSPIRGEYVQLVAQVPLPQNAQKLAFDIGTGTGVLAAILAKRGVQKVIATDTSARALACATQNITRLHLHNQVDIIETDLFPEGKAALIVCNPPWLPGRPSSPLEYAIFDLNSAMLKGFLNGLKAHLEKDGEGWLILSDLAEHLGLRSRQELQTWISTAGLKVLERIDIKPIHPKTEDKQDLLYFARSQEITSLWRLAMG